MMETCPFVSIILPEKNEAKHIGACLDSLLSQSYPSEKYEIIIVDGQSSDNTLDIISTYQELNKSIYVLSNPKSIVPISMNLGIRQAKGEFIVRVDAHATYHQDYVKACVEYLKKTGAANVGGPMIAVGEEYMGKAIAFAHKSRFGLGGGKFHDGTFEGEVDTVYLGAFRRDIFEKVGYYDERLTRNQDIELNCRIRESGEMIYLTPAIKSVYFNRSSLKSLWQQNYKNGYWNVITRAINSKALSMRHFVPCVFVLTLLVGCLCALTLFGQLLLLASLGSYLIVNLLFSAQIGKNSGLLYALVMPLVFITLHFSYGVGTFISLLKGNFISSKFRV
ncbi:glycosyltransferase family 2 protein [Paenibacillus sp. SI8]|uniref:glycosyltransferase family 2 protein n=1 Tax=unclassified Paenibacillus TaxID=185978 RepID=UPI0034660D3B